MEVFQHVVMSLKTKLRAQWRAGMKEKQLSILKLSVSQLTWYLYWNLPRIPLIFTCMSINEKNITKKMVKKRVKKKDSYISTHGLILSALLQKWGGFTAVSGMQTRTVSVQHGPPSPMCSCSFLKTHHTTPQNTSIPSPTLPTLTRSKI